MLAIGTGESIAETLIAKFVDKILNGDLAVTGRPLESREHSSLIC